MEITREDLLSRCEVDTTTPTPSPKKLKKGGGKKPNIHVAAGVNAKKAKIAAAKTRAKELFERCSEESDSESSSASVVVKLQKELAELKKKMESKDNGNRDLNMYTSWSMYMYIHVCACMWLFVVHMHTVAAHAHTSVFRWNRMYIYICIHPVHSCVDWSRKCMDIHVGISSLVSPFPFSALFYHCKQKCC